MSETRFYFYGEPYAPGEAEAHVRRHFMDILAEKLRDPALNAGGTVSLTVKVPAALLEEAKRRTCIESDADLGRVAVAMLTEPDPAVKFMLENEGALGPDHDLDY